MLNTNALSICHYKTTTKKNTVDYHYEHLAFSISFFIIMPALL